MTSPQAEPTAQALSESLAALAGQVAALRGQVALINERLDHAGLRGDLDLAAPRHLGTIHPGPEWHHTYGSNRPDLARALEFYDRWLPNTMRRIASITRTCSS